MATPPGDRSVLSAEADARELDAASAERSPLDRPMDHGVLEIRDRQNIVALEEETRRRLEVESTLRDSEARYRLLYDNNPTMYFTLSPDGTVVSVNQFGATQLGYQPDELIGQSILKVFKPDEHHAVLGQLTVCAASPMKVFQWEIQKVRKDGSTLWVKERAQAVMDHRGQILALVVCEDITERRVTEDCMRESEERWRALFEHAAVGIAQLSVSGQFLRVNPRLCETLGYSSKTMLQRTCQDFIHTNDQCVAQTHLSELVAGKRPSFFMETRWHRSDDIWVWVDMTVSMVRDANCIPAYFIAVVQNITDRKLAEEALQKSETRFRQIAETIEEVVWSADPGIGKTLYISPAYERVWGRTCASLYEDPDSFVDSIHPDDRGTVLGALAEHADGIPFDQEYRIVRPDGSVRWIWDRGFPVRDPGSGRLTHYVGVALDITERRQAEEALRRSELAVRQAFEDRERLSQDLHDNLLQSLYAVGMGLELTKQRIQRVSRTNAKRLEQSVGQLNQVIREVRTFISHVQPPVLLEQTIADLLRALAGSFTATGAGEIVVVVDDEAAVRLSAEQRTHVLAIAKEALSNSIRHTKADKRTVSLRRHGNKIRLEISDNGHGFSPVQRRTHGMGLRNMRARARKLRGRIAITSVLRQGTTVTLTIPSA
jgi:PAS domain S-box-containing protein